MRKRNKCKSVLEKCDMAQKRKNNTYGYKR